MPSGFLALSKNLVDSFCLLELQALVASLSNALDMFTKSSRCSVLVLVANQVGSHGASSMRILGMILTHSLELLHRCT